MALSVFRLSCVFVAVGALLSSLELLSMRELGAGGMRTVCAIRAGMALVVGALVASGGSAWIGAISVALAALLVAQAVMLHQLSWCCDGADYMLTILMAGLASFAVLRQTPGLALAGFAFIAVQVCVAYANAGISKMRSPLWRSGEAIPRILSTTTFGNPRLARWLRHRPLVARSLAWCVIGFECAFPLTVFGPRVALVAFIAAGACFHLANAAIMGVDGFLWSFGGTYPSMFLVHTWVHAGHVA